MGDNIKVNLKELGCGGANVIRLAYVSVEFNRRGLINTSVCLSVCLSVSVCLSAGSINEICQ